MWEQSKCFPKETIKQSKCFSKLPPNGIANLLDGCEIQLFEWLEPWRNHQILRHIKFHVCVKTSIVGMV